MELRILGPVEAVEDGRPLALGAPKQRAVLVALLLRRNRTVTRDQLAAAIWGEHPPDAAARSLQVYVHGLRRALGADRIETHGSGYSLRVEPGELDLERFEALVERARRALPDDPGGAADCAAAALALWRGPALADLTGEPIASLDGAPLDEARLTALELRADAELAGGRHAALVHELEALVAEHPYRERFREQLVLALYRCGRQKDALDAYRDARRTLDEELGIEPGPALRALERAVLHQDPSIAAPAAPGEAQVALPTPPTPLVGRLLEVAAVTALFRDGARLVTLTGPGGTGKTRLALAVAEELAHDLDGAVFVDLSAVRDPELLGATVAETLGVREGEEVVLEAVAERLRPARQLLLLDNLEQLLAGTPFVAELLARAPRLLVLATSRAPLRLRAEHEYPVPPLAAPDPAAVFEQLAANDAVRLFSQRARAVSPAFQLTEENAPSVAAICARLDGLPLAIELAAARTRLLPPETMASRLGRTLDLLTGGPRDLAPRQQTLRATLDWSHDALDPGAQRLLAELSVFAGGCSLESVEAVSGPDSLAALETLVDMSLLRRLPGEARFALLETIREYAAERLAESGERETVLRRHGEHFLAEAEAAYAELVAGAGEATFDRIEREHDNLRAALDWAADAAETELEVRLLESLSQFWIVRGHLREAQARFERAVGLTEGDPPLHARVLVQGAVFPFRLRDLATAQFWWEEALELYRGLDDVDGITRCTAELGAVALAEGDLDRARALCEEAAAGFEQLGNLVRQGIVKANLSAIANMQGDLPGALAYGIDAIALQEEVGDTDGLAITLHNVGRTSTALGDRDGARRHLERSLRLATSIGYREVVAYGLESVAELAALEADEPRALRYLLASEAAFAELGTTVLGEEADGAERLLERLTESLGAEAVANGGAAAADDLEAALADALAYLAAPAARAGAPH